MTTPARKDQNTIRMWMYLQITPGEASASHLGLPLVSIQVKCSCNHLDC